MFKRGSQYTRADIGWICLPETGRPKGGHWDTGYVKSGNNLIIFMNIGIPGRTEHDFDNRFDENNQTVVWYGKPNAHSKQGIFKKIFSGELTPHFFARWKQSDAFTYLGIGKVITWRDGVTTKQGFETIELTVNVQDVPEIIPEISTDNNIQTHSFAFERHLEDFLITNWLKTPLGEKYDIYEVEGELVGKQFKTDTGPMDILAISKDKKEFLVVELKRDRASDAVIGQTMRYMGWVKKNLLLPGQIVKGCIIALESDRRLDDALFMTEDISFIRYEVDFRLIEH